MPEELVAAARRSLGKLAALANTTSGPNVASSWLGPKVGRRQLLSMRFSTDLEPA